ncbi:MAG TPA: hypothetical protein VFG20_01515 [Planctomycetaceae bacterium]|nr:hypothetical protein [Planctomycetaceae bacterium]
MRRLLPLCGTGLVLFAVLAFLPASAPRVTSANTLKAAGTKQWYRGNMHTHSLWSDGDNFLENIALWYREQKYDFLVFTDHNTLARSERWIDVDKAKSGRKAYAQLKKNFPDQILDREKDGKTEVRLKTFPEVVDLVGIPEKFLLIQGEEVSDKFGKLPVHLCAANLQEMIPPLGGQSVAEAIQNDVNALIAQRERTRQAMMIHLNHPNFGWGVTAEDLAQVRGENFFEVYNGHPGVHNSGDAVHASTERIWDIINTLRLTELQLPMMYGLATDDGHSYHNIPSRASEPGRGWVMVLANALTPDALIASMEAGQFYASSGVFLEEVTAAKTGIALKIRGEEGVTYRTEFVGTRKDFDRTSSPVKDEQGNELPVTRRYSDDVGTVLASSESLTPSYSFRGDELYVRARVVSSKKHPNPSEIDDLESAWTQPTRGPANP